jgi:hypothetical protein
LTVIVIDNNSRDSSASRIRGNRRRRGLADDRIATRSLFVFMEPVSRRPARERVRKMAGVVAALAGVPRVASESFGRGVPREH